MDVISYVGLSHQRALERQMDLIANNIANASTAGYQREMMQFETFTDVMEGTALKSAAPVSFVLDFGVARDVTPGELSATGNPLDIGIVGQGYFTVQSAAGERLYTRNGHFLQDNEGYIATLGGARLLDESGQPMRIEAEDKSISVSGDGMVRSDTRDIGRIVIVRFDDAKQVERAGENLMRAKPEATPRPVDDVKLRGGMLENSNVQPIVEIAQMIALQRSYEQTSRLMDRMEDMRKRGIDRLSRVQ
jgi:flagellar basal-body rod protein FlgF